MEPAVDSGLLIRMADEGIPLAAIARSVKIPSGQLRDRLKAALADGLLLELPRDDWPPGFPRDQRALQLSRLTTENKIALLLAMRQQFKITPRQVGLLLALVQNVELARLRVTDMSANLFNVHMCALRRRLAPFGVQIETLWGFGYRLNHADRHRVMDLVLGAVTTEQRAVVA